MYQYVAILQSTKETIAEAHTISEIEGMVVHFRRGQKHGEHTHGNDKVEIFHIQRDKLHGTGKPVLVKVI